MAIFGPPPTPALREEWRNLSKEIRREAIDMLFGPRGMTDSEVQARLVELGFSAELAEWAAGYAMEQIRGLGRMIIDEPVLRRGRLDRFNHLLVSVIVFFFSLTWFAQEAQTLREGTTPIGIVPASVMTLVSFFFFMACLRRWIYALKRK